MSEGFLTNAGRDLLAAKQGASEVLVIDRFLLANIAGLDPSDPPNLDEPTPDVGDQVATLPVTQSGYVSADKVVYSLYLGTQVGDFTFNWVGLLADDDTLVAVRYIEPISKYATSGQALGNAITRNFLITYTDAQAITNVTVEASSWQVQFDDATTEQKGLVELATQTEMTAETDPARVPAVNVVASYVAAKIAALVDSSPGTLDTLNELAAALGDDPNFATTMTNALAEKLNTSDVNLTGVDSATPPDSAALPVGISRFYSNAGGTPNGGWGGTLTIKTSSTRAWQIWSSDTYATHIYYRNNSLSGSGWQTWRQLLTDAPSDGEQYVRKDGAWSLVDVGDQDLSDSGWKLLPGGLILQWGKKLDATFGSSDITLPVTFPTAFFSVYISGAEDWSDQQYSDNSTYAGAEVLSASAFRIYNRSHYGGGGKTLDFYWFAIGY